MLRQAASLASPLARSSRAIGKRTLCFWCGTSALSQCNTSTGLGRGRRTRGFSTHSRLLQATQFQSNTQSDITSKQIIDALNPAPVFSLGDSAAKRINEINGIEKKNQALRIIVDSGGCHGYQYKMELTTDQEEDDIIFEKDGARVLVDPVSIDLIRGSRLEYVEELIGSSFQVVDNPNAESSCGCKVSFNIKI